MRKFYDASVGDSCGGDSAWREIVWQLLQWAMALAVFVVSGVSILAGLGS